VTYKDTSVTQLRLSTLFGKTDGSLQLDVVDSVTNEFTDIYANKVRIESTIIGASHAVTVIDAASGEMIIQEILANIDVARDAGPQRDMIVREFRTGEVMQARAERKAIAYQFCGYAVTLEQLGNDHDFDAIRTLADRGGASQGTVRKTAQRFVFPHTDASYPIKPQTLIETVYGIDTITIKSYHVYPNEGKAFASTSTVTIQGNFRAERRYGFVKQTPVGGTVQQGRT